MRLRRLLVDGRERENRWDDTDGVLVADRMSGRARGSPGALREGMTIEVELSLADDPCDTNSDRSIISACTELEQLTGTPKAFRS